MLPILHQQYAETERAINNFLNAIQQGIITESTKQRMEELEQLKSELSVQIAKEEIAQPTLTREQILFWFHRLRKMDVKKIDHRRRLIDSFINSIYLFDDRMVITFNYKDGSKTITFEEIENTVNGSDLTAFGAPKFDADFDTICVFFCPPLGRESPSHNRVDGFFHTILIAFHSREIKRFVISSSCILLCAVFCCSVKLNACL